MLIIREIVIEKITIEMTRDEAYRISLLLQKYYPKPAAININAVHEMQQTLDILLIRS